jgi:16S rRNA (uracil1498-N3)-methyltransferase
MAAAIALPATAGHHLARVLRLRPGDGITLFDGQGASAPGRIEELVRDDVQVRLDAAPVQHPVPALRLTLAQALPQGDKMDWILEKAVELGASGLQPLQARRSLVRLDPNRAARRTRHWSEILVAACAQSGQNWLPILAELKGASDWLSRSGPCEPTQLKLLLDPHAELSLHDLDPEVTPSDVLVAIGPESGWDPTELEVAARSGWTFVRAGPRVLRTETAGLAMLAVLQARWGDWRQPATGSAGDQ